MAHVSRFPRFCLVVLSLLVCLVVANLSVSGPVAEAGPETWTSGGPIDSIRAVAVAPSLHSTVYAIGNAGLWRSTDSGASWTLASTIGFGSGSPLVVHPNNHSILFSGGRDAMQGIIKSTDGGATWSVIRSGQDCTALAIDPTRPDTIYAGVKPSPGSARMYKSTDGGATWAAITAEHLASPGIPSYNSIAVDRYRPDTVYASLASYHGGSLLRSQNGGAAWTPIWAGQSATALMYPTALALYDRADSAALIYSGWGLVGLGVLIRSNDGGASFTNMAPTLPSTTTISGITVPGRQDWVVASIAGESPTGEQADVFLSADAGGYWIPLRIPQRPGRLASVGTSSTPYTIYAATDKGVWQYTLPRSLSIIYVVDRRFRSYYDAYDGLRILGSPISGGTMVGSYYAQYFEKGRIEDHSAEVSDPIWRFMYGLLVDELQATGIGLPVGGDASTATYATIKAQASADLRVAPPAGFVSGVMANPDGSVFVPFTTDLSAARGHNVFSPFWTYISDMSIFPGGWLHDVGLPITEPITATVDKGDIRGRQITIQAFQRTILTHDPLNPPGWRTERANVGADYRKAFPSALPIFR